MNPPACFHLLPGSTGGDWVSWAATGAPWVKLCNASSIKPAIVQGTRVYYRPCFLPGDDGEGDCSDGAAWATIVIEAIRAAGDIWPHAISFRNELNPTTANAEQYQRYRAALRAAGYAGPVAYGSFSSGRPNWDEYATIPQDADALELHEYWTGSVVGSPYTALRHATAIAKGLIPATLPIIIGEVGEWDDGKGWQASPTSAEPGNELHTYLAGCAKSVEQAYWFTDGDNGDPQWRSFNARGTQVEAAIRATWPQQKPEGVMLQGLDVSSNNGPVDWPIVPNEYAFAACKATEGVGYLDSQFDANWPAIYRHGFTRIAYHFARPDLGNDPVAEADYSLEQVGTLDTGDLLALDLEVGDGDLSGWALAWLQRVELVAGFKPLLYASPSFLAEHNLTGNAALASYPLWLASYTGSDAWPEPPAGWASIAIWQNSSTGSVTGIAGNVDTDLTQLSIDHQLRALGKPQPQAGGGTVVDSLTQAAIARFSALGVKPNVGGALFASYRQMVNVWMSNGLAGVLDPTPAIKPEAVTPDGSSAFLLLDSGRILHWRRDTGLVYQAEQSELPAIYKTCGWTWPQAA